MAVFTPVDRAALDAFLANYDLAPLTGFEGIAEGVENTNYCITTADRPYILTLYERHVRADDLPFFLGLMGFLAHEGVPTARPIARQDGGVLGNLCGRPAALIEFLAGKAMDAPTPAHAASAGAALARLHGVGQRFASARANDLGPGAWRDLLDRNQDGADDLAPNLALSLSQHLDETLATWPTGLPRGIIHADLFPDNVLFEGSNVTGVIDFYFACTDFLAYDLAIMINAWAFNADGRFQTDISAAIIAGYESVRKLESAERAALPILAQGAALRFILTRLNDWLAPRADALVTPKDPLALLPHLEFHAKADTPSVYGA